MEISAPPSVGAVFSAVDASKLLSSDDEEESEPAMEAEPVLCEADGPEAEESGAATRVQSSGEKATPAGSPELSLQPASRASSAALPSGSMGSQPVSKEARFRTAALRFYYAALSVLHSCRVEASNPLNTSLDQFRLLLTEQPADEDRAEWQDSVCTVKERLGAMLADAEMAGAVQCLLDQPVEIVAGVGSPSRVAPMHQVVPNVWVGSVQNAHDISKLQECGITHVCTCCERDVVQYSDVFKYLKIVVGDDDSGGSSSGGDGDGNIARYFWKTNNFIQEAIDGGGGVLVHCVQGMSASPTCVIAFLMQSARLTYSAALAAVRSVRPAIRPTAGFVAQLRQYEAKLLRPDGTLQEPGAAGSQRTLVAEPALSTLEDEIGSLNSRIRTMTASAKKARPPPPRRAVPRELKLGGATLRLTYDGRLKVSGVRIPDPEHNAFIPEKRDGSIWV